MTAGRFGRTRPSSSSRESVLGARSCDISPRKSVSTLVFRRLRKVAIGLLAVRQARITAYRSWRDTPPYPLSSSTESRLMTDSSSAGPSTGTPAAASEPGIVPSEEVGEAGRLRAILAGSPVTGVVGLDELETADASGKAARTSTRCPSAMKMFWGVRNPWQ
jgi:hypothetical protein